MMNRRNLWSLIVVALILVFYPGFCDAAGAAELRAEPGTTDQSKRWAVEAYGKLPLSFEANHGQTDSQVRFLSRGRGYTLFLTGNEAVLALQKGPSEAQSGKSRDAGERLRPGEPSREQAASAVLRMKLVGADPKPKVEALDELPGKSNYFLGNDPEKWRTDVPNYAKVRYENVYPGVDLVYYGNQQELEYDFVVAPGTDSKVIELAIAGADEIAVDSQGNLVLSVEGGEVRFYKPVMYQPASVNPKSKIADRKYVDGRYVLRAKNRVGFEVSAYSSNIPLVIDPVLEYSTYLGGTYVGWGEDIAVDSSGNAYVTGGTLSNDFPAVNPIQGYAGGTCGIDPDTYPCPDVFISKLNAAGNELIYSTYLGGTDEDWGYGIAVDASGNAYITGQTFSSDFPTLTPVHGTYGGGGDLFVTKLNSAGSMLLYSTYYYWTYYGEGKVEYGIDITVDASGNAFVAGGIETDVRGHNALVVRTSPPSAYGRSFGGTDDEWAESIAVDPGGNVYVAGVTFSADYSTQNAFDSTFGGGTCGTEPDTFPCPDAFVEKWTPGEVSEYDRVFSTYLGGSDYDLVRGLAIDASADIYVSGQTWSIDFPIQNPIQETLGGNADAFVTKFNAGGATLAYSTYLGGSGGDGAWDIGVDPEGSAYVTGHTGSNAFPTANPIQATRAGDFDVFLSKLSPTGSNLVFSTYLGSADEDDGYGLALDSSGNAYITGLTWSTDFPTVNALQPALAGAANAFVSKISFVGVSLSPSHLDFGTQPVGATSTAQAATLSNNGTTDLSMIIATSGDFAETDDCGSTLVVGAECTISVTFTPTAVGTRNGELTVTSDAPDSPHVVSLTGEGTAAPIVLLSPTALNFGSQAINVTSQPQTVTLTNDGNATLNIASIVATGDFAQTNDCGPSLAASANCAISVTFTPTVEGVIAGQVTVTSDAPNSPHVVTLSGTGTQAQPAISLSRTLIDFGSRLVGTASDSETVTITNTGNADLNVSSVEFTSGNVDDFTRGTEDCVGRSPIAPTGQCTVSLSFNPTAVGDRVGVVSITSDAPGSPHTINLTGTGTDFTLGMASGSSASATVNAGGTATYTVEVEPSGYSGTATISCSDNITRGSCTCSPTSLTLVGSTSQEVTVTATTTAPSMAPPSMRLPPPGVGGHVRAPWLLWLLILAMLGSATLLARRRTAWGLTVALLSVMLWAACGGGGGGGFVPQPQPGTPAGTYTITVSATAGGVTRTADLSLTVN